MSEAHFGHIAHKASSPTLSSFAPSKILPLSSMDEPDFTATKFPQIDSANESMLHGQGEEIFEEETNDPRMRRRFSTDQLNSYDLAPPPPKISHDNAEVLAERLFSADHLNIILKEPVQLHHFTTFLNKHRPHSAPILVRYLESQKALTAIRYANSLADQISLHSRRSSRSEAAVVDPKFESFSRRSIDELVSEALPAYITYRMVIVVTECLVKEITGNNTPLMRELVQGLAEVYCMSDPSLPDNPIVFASEEFYNTTQYGREYVIGKNCRFLQGPRTSQQAVKRISEALKNGKEVCEILLNYRRDGSPFLNLVMMAPMMDHRGNVRYFIGCQIDISHLIEDGRGLDSFKQLLANDQEKNEKKHEKPLPDPLDHKPSLKVLRELGGQLNDEEIEVVKERHRRNSIESGLSTPTRVGHTQTTRKFLGMDEPMESNIWPPSQFGSIGRLPGVYQNFILVRPYPSLRIIFTSPSLRIPGLSQSRLMDRIGGPSHVREGLLEALAQGVGVTAKISWLTHASRSSSSSSAIDADIMEGKPRWINCTPLMGSDSKPGVIMIVMVDKEVITGSLTIPSPTRSRMTLRSRDHPRDNWPLRGLGQFTSEKLYADYLRREGRTTSTEERRAESRSEMRSLASQRSLRSLRSADEWIRDVHSRSASARRTNGREITF